MKIHRISLGIGAEDVVLSEEEQLLVEQEWVTEAKNTEDELQAEQTRIELEQTDAEMARASEDLIDLLIAKGIITQEELPNSVLEVIAKRKNLRNTLI